MTFVLLMWEGDVLLPLCLVSLPERLSPLGLSRLVTLLHGEASPVRSFLRSDVRSSCGHSRAASWLRGSSAAASRGSPQPCSWSRRSPSPARQHQEPRVSGRPRSAGLPSEAGKPSCPRVESRQGQVPHQKGAGDSPASALAEAEERALSPPLHHGEGCPPSSCFNHWILAPEHP